MKALETRIPPPVVILLTGAIAWLASSAFAPTGIAWPVRLISAGILLMAGFLIALAGVWAIRWA